MQSLEIVEVDVLCDLAPCFLWILVRVEIDLFVFQASPKPFYEYVVEIASFTIHADLHTCCQKALCELIACVLTSLVTVEDFWP